MDRLLVFEGESTLTMSLDGGSAIAMPTDGDAGVYISGTSETHETYTGAYEVTPTREEQVLETAQKILLENVIVKPIPRNYGLISWDGAVMTVS